MAKLWTEFRYWFQWGTHTGHRRRRLKRILGLSRES